MISGNKITYNLKEKNGKSISTINCDGGATATENNGVVTITNINASQTCTILLQFDFTMTSNACPDVTNDNSSACYIIAHGVGSAYITKDWDGVANVRYYSGTGTYKNCKIISYRQKMGASCIGNPGEAEHVFFNEDLNRWVNRYGDGNWQNIGCAVTLNCDDIDDDVQN